MFHRFSAAPAKARKQANGSELTPASNITKDRDAGSILSPDSTNLPPAKRRKASRACDRCRQYRVKCDEQKPCAQCVGINANCVVSYAKPRSSQASNGDINRTKVSTSQGSSTTTTAPRNIHKEYFDLASHIQGFFASGQPSFSQTSAIIGFPQLLYPALPEGARSLGSDQLLKSQRSYYLRLFWDACHPLLQIMSETEFSELDALPPSTTMDAYSAKNALVDSMVALGIQHSHAAGLAGRVLGLHQPSPRQNNHAASSPEATWPGFEYFHRCRECMRTNTDVTLEALQCHALMVLYFMKGNAFRDAYNLLGITIRKAYMARLHRPPPSHLHEARKTARMQLWWMLFSLDLQCSLQLDMPAASQKSLAKCPFPAEDALARYFPSISHPEESVNAYRYSTQLIKLAVIVTDIGARVSTADLVDDDGNSSAALENHALNLSSALQSLEVWRDQLPSDMRLSQYRSGFGSPEMSDFNRDLALPAWLQRQIVLLELHYHNVYTLIQRPFIRLRYAHFNETGGTIIQPDFLQPHMELHITSALYHATKIVDTLFNVCSTSDVLYGWSEVLQPLWNATLAIMAYIYANPLNSVVPQALDSLTRAQAIFESFSPTSPTALSAKKLVQSLANSLQKMVTLSSLVGTNDDPMG